MSQCSSVTGRISRLCSLNPKILEYWAETERYKPVLTSYNGMWDRLFSASSSNPLPLAVAYLHTEKAWSENIYYNEGDLICCFHLFLIDFSLRKDVNLEKGIIRSLEYEESDKRKL